MEKPSRDRLRKLMLNAGELLAQATAENDALKDAARAEKKSLLQYRYCEAHLMNAIANLELARIVLRKRKRKGTEEPKEAPSSSLGAESPNPPVNQD